MTHSNSCNCNCCRHESAVEPVRIGEKVPNLTFDVYHGDKEKKMSLGDFKDKWLVLLFYPKDFTFVCPTELEEMAHLYKDFQKENAEIVSVSTDTVQVHKAWHDTSEAVKKVEYPMAADPQHLLTHAFGVHIKEEGVALRGTFIIDPDGTLQTTEINPDGVGRSGKETLRKLRALKFVREHGAAKVCPASWEPGDDTLEPGLGMVGKI